MKVTVIPIVISMLRTIPKGLVRGREDLENKAARILRRVLETWGNLTCCHSNFSKRPLTNAGVKNFPGVTKK